MREIDIGMQTFTIMNSQSNVEVYGQEQIEVGRERRNMTQDSNSHELKIVYAFVWQIMT